jgi:hypothetical protein
LSKCDNLLSAFRLSDRLEKQISDQPKKGFASSMNPRAK